MAQASNAKLPADYQKELERINAAHDRFLKKITALEKRRMEVMKKIHSRVDQEKIEKIRSSLK